jgi:hypothetical protein
MDRYRTLALSGLLLAGASCARREPPPAARLSAVPATLSLSYPGTARIEATWEPLMPLPGAQARLHVFVHLLERPGQVLRTFDHPLAIAWEVGERRTTAIELWQSALDPPIPPGIYDLTIGLYDPESGRRFPLAAGGEALDREEYRLARLEVLAAASAVRASFGPDWLPPEAGSDRQVLNRRWLAGSGEIVFDSLPAAMVLTLALQLPDPSAAGHRLVLDQEEAVPAVRIEAGCSDERAEVTGFGAHRVRLRLSPASPCTVRLDANFAAVDPGSLARRSIALEVLAWDAAGGSSQGGPAPE